MNETEQQKLLEAIAPLDQFAANTALPRGWHAQWQSVYQQVIASVQAITAEKPTERNETQDEDHD